MTASRTKTHGAEACSGCSLCLLVCPVWRSTLDIRMTPHGRAKAMQHGVSAADLADSVDACTLCGACEPICPEQIPLLDMVLDLRAELARATPARIESAVAGLQTQHDANSGATSSTASSTATSTMSSTAASTTATLLLPDRALLAQPTLLQTTMALFAAERASVAADSGADIAAALEAGAGIPEARLARFLAPLRSARRLIVCDGMLLRALRGWLPRQRIDSLGLSASSLAAVSTRLRPDDLYVIEPSAYHADRERLVGHYDGLRLTSGCMMNLDLQRLAIPTTAKHAWLPEKRRVDAADQARWILEGLPVSRIVVEDCSDIAVFRSVAPYPVLHIAELGEAS